MLNPKQTIKVLHEMQAQETEPTLQNFGTESLPIAETRAFNLHPEDTVYMANGLQPMREEKLVFNGEEKSVDVVASITQRHNGEDKGVILLTKEPATLESPVQANLVHRNGEKTIVQKSKIIKAEGVTGIGFDEDGKKVARTRLDTSDYHGWAAIRSDSSAEMTVSEASHPKVITRQDRLRGERLKRRMKKTLIVGLALLAFKATTGPGGVIDRVADPHNNAAEYVSKEIPDIDKTSFDEDVEEEIDAIPANGVVWDGVNLTKEEAAEWVKEDAEVESPYYGAVDRVAKTMGDMDSHNEADITKRANEFKARLGDEILSDKQTREIQKTISDAENIEELKGTMTKYMERFNAEFSLTEGEKPPSLDSVRYLSRQIVESLSPLPSSLVRKSIGEDTFEISFKPSDPSEHNKMSATLGSKSDNTLTINGRALTTKIIPEILLTRDTTTKQTILHEIAHGLNIDEALGEDGNNDNYGVTKILESLATHAVGHPEKTTLYAAQSNKDEEVAESAADILRGDFASPDHYLDFTSGANSSRLKVLIALESLPGPNDYSSEPGEYYKGITDYLVAKFKQQSVK